MTESELRRFEAKTITDPSGCILWVGAKNNRGYGNVSMGGKYCKAHRLAYEHAYGPIPVGKEIDHLCRVRACVRPDHLRAVTHRENVLAEGATSFAKRNADKTHCVNGHPLTLGNLVPYYLTLGYRKCRLCARADNRRIYHRKRARCAESA